MTKHEYHKLRTSDPSEYWHRRWEEYKETHDKQKQAIATILEKLISRNRKKGNCYSKDDIDTAILDVRGVDKRTRDNWFLLLWKLDYLHQPVPAVYSINFEKVTELELTCKLSPQLSRKQQRLKEFFK